MAYTDKQKEEMYNKALSDIKKLNLFFIEDIIAYMPVGKTSFYEFWPLDSNEMNTIKDLLEENKINEKVLLRESFRKGNSSAERLALYKLICTDKERKSLSMNHIDVTTDGKEIQNTTIIAISKEEQDKINKLLENFETE